MQIMLVITATAAHVAIRLLILAVTKSGLEDQTTEVKYTSLGYHAYGQVGEAAAAAAVALQQLGPCVMYIQISADVLVPILCEAGGPGGIWCDTTFWQLISVCVVIYPICLIRRMDSLKSISAVAMGCIMAFSVAVVVRGVWVLCDTSLRQVDYRAIEPLWNTTSIPSCVEEWRPGCYSWVPPGDSIYFFRSQNVLAAMPVLCFSFLCHQNMFPIYEDLEGASHKRMTSVSMVSMGLCVALYFAVGVFGYIIFLDSNEPNRQNGASGDVLRLFTAKSNGKDFALVMDILRVGYGVSLILSYPVMLFELRHVLEKYAVGEDQPYSMRRHLAINTCVIALCTFVAIKVKSVGTMFGLIGSTTSPAIVFILPAFFYLKLRPDGQMRPFAWILGTIGIALIPLCLYSWASNLKN